MFSGIVEAIGTVATIQHRPGGMTLTIRAPAVLNEARIGDSIALNGVCLTIVRYDAETFDVELAPETVRKTSLGQLQARSEVNLERALAASGRIGGHVVQGHVDAGEGIMATFRAPVALLKYIVPKGYIAIDGMSLTVVDTGPDWFSISFIPHTRAVTIVRHYAPGFLVNLEVDILGKYVEKLLASRPEISPHETLRAER
jgi:riboflavin synthase